MAAPAASDRGINVNIRFAANPTHLAETSVANISQFEGAASADWVRSAEINVAALAMWALAQGREMLRVRPDLHEAVRSYF